SFVRAGVIPALEHGGEAWEAFVLRPGPRPLEALADLLPADAELPGSSPTTSREKLASWLRVEPGLLGAHLRGRARRRLKRVLLFVDQLEELYTLAEEPHRRAFLACIAGVADDAGSPLRVVLAIRSDFLDRLAEARAVVRARYQALLFLPPLGRDGL